MFKTDALTAKREKNSSYLGRILKTELTTKIQKKMRRNKAKAQENLCQLYKFS